MLTFICLTISSSSSTFSFLTLFYRLFYKIEQWFFIISIFQALSKHPNCFYLNKIYNETENTFQSLRLKTERKINSQKKYFQFSFIISLKIPENFGNVQIFASFVHMGNIFTQARLLPRLKFKFVRKSLWKQTLPTLAWINR